MTQNINAFKVFATAVYVETNGDIELTVLSRDSEQYQRCRKAVKDNTSPDIFNDVRFEGIKVLNVTNIKNTVLSKKLAVRIIITLNSTIKFIFYHRIVRRNTVTKEK